MNATPTNRANLNVLVVDDDLLAQKIVKKALEALGVHKIEVVSDGQAALQTVQAQEQSGSPFNVVVCDWEMPVMDGITFLENFAK